MRNVESNIGKLYALQAFDGALFMIPVMILFYFENGLTLKDAFLLQSVFSISLVVWEIPSGYLSDRWSRRHTILAGTALNFFAMLFYAQSDAFVGFLIAEILLGIGTSFLSGTIEAMTYDTLLELDRTDEYRKISGQQFFIHFTSEAVVSVLAGAIAIVSLRATMWATLIPFGLAFIIAITLIEPSRHKMQETQHLKILWDIATHTLWRHVPLRSIIVLSAIISTLTLSLFWFTQPYQQDAALPLSLFGLVHGLIVITGAIASKYTQAMERWIDDRIFLVLIAVAVIVSYLALGLVTSLWMLPFFFLTRAAWGFLSPLTSDLVNRMASSDVRATVLSLKAFAGRLLFAIVSPLLGYAADVFTLNQALLIAGLTGGLALTVTFALMKPIWKQIPR